ncbi:helix-turn-helix transcriptional regulator [Chryseobacterium sp. SIMBA_038]|uniref:helix-turn-helix transcriptional regulator n=1 Tax=Chryseobacterium sp. SIMBA_038 TaxID=3085780 RepID=UPI00397E82FE
MQRIKRVKRTFFTIIFFLFYNCFYAQKDYKKKIDSINGLIEKSYIEGNFDENIILKNVTDLYYLSRENSCKEGQIISLFEQAKIYFINGDLNKTLVKINEGIDLAKSKKDYNSLCRFLLIYQDLLFKIDYLNISKQILAKAEEYNDLVSSPEEKSINDIYILLGKADLLALNENMISINQIIRLKKQAYAEALKIKDSNKLKRLTLIYTLESLTESLVKFGKTKEAKKYINSTDILLKAYPSEGLVIQNLVIKGNAENTDENYDQAIKYFSLAISKAKESKNAYILYEIYPLISESYEGLNSPEKAKIYSHAYAQILDSVDTVKDKTSEINYIDSIRYKVLNKNKQKITERCSLIIFSVILGIISIIILLKIKIKNKQNLNLSISKTLPETEIPSEYGAEDTKELVFLAKKDINTFYLEFQKQYPSFYKTLKDNYSELNVSDINFCSLIKLNFSIKEISQLTNSSLRAAEARKYRINKKMQLKSQNELFIILSILNN